MKEISPKIFSGFIVVGVFTCLLILALVQNPLIVCGVPALAILAVWTGRRHGVFPCADWTWGYSFRGLIAVLVGLCAAFLFLSGHPYPLLLASVAMLFAVLAIANNLTSGLLGYVDLSAAGVFAVGAYTGGLLGINLGLSVPLTLLAGLIAGAVVGGLVSVAAVRMRGNEIAMATLAVTVVINGLLINAGDLTGGPDGFGGISGWDSVLPFLDGGRRADFVVSSLTLVAVWWGFRNLRCTRHWRGWIAVGDDVPAAMSCGIRLSRAVQTAFIIAGAVAGLAGAEYAHIQQHISPGNFGLMESIMVVCAVMLGGRGSLIGPPVAAVILWMVPEQLHFAYYGRMLLFGALLLVMLRLRPEGLFPLLPMRYPPDTFPPLSANPPSNAAVSLNISGLSKHFNGFNAVEGVSFHAHAGESLVITGANGSGKTLTIDMITGYLVPTYGTVSHTEREIQGWEPDRVARLGIRRTFQESRLFARLSVLEHTLVGNHSSGHTTILAAMLGLRSCRDEEHALLSRARSALAVFGKDRFLARENDPAPTFSFGNRRRIEIARCLSAEPLSILILDEPFVGMPVEDARAIGEDLRRLLQHGVLISVEHNVSLIDGFGDRVFHFNTGRLVGADVERNDGIHDMADSGIRLNLV